MGRLQHSTRVGNVYEACETDLVTKEMNEEEEYLYLSALPATRFGFTTAPATKRISHIRHYLLANFVYMLDTAFTVLFVTIIGSRSGSSGSLTPVRFTL